MYINHIHLLRKEAFSSQNLLTMVGYMMFLQKGQSDINTNLTSLEIDNLV